MMRLYDTLRGEIRPLDLRDEGRVSLYACGPTVYDHPHLGHALPPPGFGAGGVGDGPGGGDARPPGPG